MPRRLVDRIPQLAPEQLVAGMVPPRMFDDVRFATYRPDPAEPSQAAALAAAEQFADAVASAGIMRTGLFGRRLLSRASQRPGGSGLYFDGGFGVGKTHLLASLWHAAGQPKLFGTFVELTHLVGALGYRTAVARLAEHRLVCIDEFELDDPGDTVLISRLLGELVDGGVSVAATSNTLPGKLGEGRFAAEDFLREIQALAARFEVVRVDGPDFRHRDAPPAPAPMSEQALIAHAHELADSTVDDFDRLCDHLATLHPSRYGVLVRGVSAVHLRGVHPTREQSTALRLVVLADRLYDHDIPVLVSGAPVDALFTEEMLAGGYRKKYLRATSRLIALARLP
jgi:cell division protein ZapE